MRLARGLQRRESLRVAVHGRAKRGVCERNLAGRTVRQLRTIPYELNEIPQYMTHLGFGAYLFICLPTAKISSPRRTWIGGRPAFRPELAQLGNIAKGHGLYPAKRKHVQLTALLNHKCSVDCPGYNRAMIFSRSSKVRQGPFSVRTVESVAREEGECLARYTTAAAARQAAAEDSRDGQDSLASTTDSDARRVAARTAAAYARHSFPYNATLSALYVAQLALMCWAPLTSNFQYYGRDELPPEVKAAFKASSIFDIMMVARCRATRVTNMFSNKPGASGRGLGHSSGAEKLALYASVLYMYAMSSSGYGLSTNESITNDGGLLEVPGTWLSQPSI
ncbi:hypothetical protein GGX14DRAFT_406682 [Mycena pura]|uniref:Uncharacterized protein n=1 Tax=Mycena pura TaxID=153505 RepID=A0AAD6UQA9_9AGAR|nr:hypothetical protein GGX14DRAFT_406682 [Mycena pura]